MQLDSLASAVQLLVERATSPVLRLVDAVQSLGSYARVRGVWNEMALKWVGSDLVRALGAVAGRHQGGRPSNAVLNEVGWEAAQPSHAVVHAPGPGARPARRDVTCVLRACRPSTRPSRWAPRAASGNLRTR